VTAVDQRLGGRRRSIAQGRRARNYDRQVSVVVVIGTGDMGEPLAAGLAAGGRARRLVLAGRPGPALPAVAATLASVSGSLIEPVQADALRTEAVASCWPRSGRIWWCNAPP
jgi:hypothetical protein